MLHSYTINHLYIQTDALHRSLNVDYPNDQLSEWQVDPLIRVIDQSFVYINERMLDNSFGFYKHHIIDVSLFLHGYKNFHHPHNNHV